MLNDIGTEELSHLEMVSTIVHQLTRDLSMEEIEKSGFGPYYIDHTVGVWPQAAGGVPFNASVEGNAIERERELADGDDHGDCGNHDVQRLVEV